MTQTIHELFDHIGYRTTHTPGGDIAVELPVAPHVVNTNGGLQGGLLATLVDIIAGKRALEVIPPGTSVVTSDLSVRYLRPIKAGVARANARVVHSGKRSLVMQVDVSSLPDEELAAIATVSFATIRRRQTEETT